MARCKRLAFYPTLLGLLASAGVTGCSTTTSRVREIDAQAEPVLRKMCDALDGAKTFRFAVNATVDEPVDTGQLAQFHRVSEVTVARPDKLFLTAQSTNGEWAAWYKGRTLTILDKIAGVYATETVPGRIGEMLDYMADKYDLVLPMADLLVGGTYDSLVADVDVGTYLGVHSVGDTPCHHILFRQENLDWQIWVDAGEKPLPRKLVITYTQDPDQPQYIAIIDGWDLAPTVSAETFTFTPPAETHSVTMAELVAEEE